MIQLAGLCTGFFGVSNVSIYSLKSVFHMTSKWLICNFCLSFVIFLILMAKDTRQTWHFKNKSQTKARNSKMLISVCLADFRAD